MPIDKSYKQASLSKYVDCNDDRYNDNSLPLTQTFTVLLGSSVQSDVQWIGVLKREKKNSLPKSLEIEISDMN